MEASSGMEHKNKFRESIRGCMPDIVSGKRRHSTQKKPQRLQCGHFDLLFKYFFVEKSK